MVKQTSSLARRRKFRSLGESEVDEIMKTKWHYCLNGARKAQEELGDARRRGESPGVITYTIPQPYPKTNTLSEKSSWSYLSSETSIHWK